MEPVHIIGAGLAGSEAAWQITRMGVPVVLHEMRPQVETFAHKTGDCAEMVCSNSFRSDDDVMNAVDIALLGRYFERYADQIIDVASRIVFYVSGRKELVRPISGDL